jgi:hypothetical protein
MSPCHWYMMIWNIATLSTIDSTHKKDTRKDTVQIVFTFYGALQLHWCRFGKVFLSVELRILRSSTHSSGLIIDFIYSTYNSLLDYYIIGNSGHCWSSWTIIDCGVVSFKYEWWSQQQSLISGLPALPCPLRLQKLDRVQTTTVRYITSAVGCGFETDLDQWWHWWVYCTIGVPIFKWNMKSAASALVLKNLH